MRRSPYPLQWPSRLPPTKSAERRWSHFGKHCDRASLSPHLTGQEVLSELARLGATDWVITSNMPSRGAEGLPYADAPKGDDPGIAVWFQFRRVERVFACDRWRTPAENLRAIAKSIEAMRGLDRWGVADVLESVFTGFAAALPPGPPERPSWRELFAIDAAVAGLSGEDLLAIVKARHRRAIGELHPDDPAHGDTTARVATLNAALTEAERELSPTTT